MTNLERRIAQLNALARQRPLTASEQHRLWRYQCQQAVREMTGHAGHGWRLGWQHKRGYEDWIHDLPRCGATTRKGTPCRCRVLPGKTRCKFHGGLSTGPKTTEGRHKSLAALQAGHRAWRERKKADRSGKSPCAERD